jgi:hypothetical protein
MLLLAAIQAYRKQARCKRQLVRVFERHSFLIHGGSLSRAGYSNSERSPSTAITTESLSASVPAARKHTHQTLSPPWFAQRPARSPPQARFCAFDHLPNMQRCGRADSTSATKQPPYPTTKANYAVNQLGLKSGRGHWKPSGSSGARANMRYRGDMKAQSARCTHACGKTSDVYALG